MNFAEFLTDLRRKKNYTSIAAQFHGMGGEEILGISLRRWTQIAGGKTPPTEKLLLSIFNQTDALDKKHLISSFFKSIYSESNDSKTLLNYIDRFLLPSLEKPQKSVWEIKSTMYYSDEQLEYLTNNIKALRLFKKIFLLDDVILSVKDVDVDKKTLNKMVSLDLITIKKDKLYPGKKRYRLPKYGEHNSRTMSLASKFMLKHIDAYISYEGSDHQSLQFTTLMVTPDKAKIALEQIEAFKDWLLSLHESDPNPDAVPLVFLGFLKMLGRYEV